MSSLLPGNLVPKKKTVFSGRVARIKKVKNRRAKDMKSSGRIPSIGTINNEKDSNGEDSIQSSDLSSNTSSDDSASQKSGSGEDKRPREYVKPTVTQSKFVRLKK